MEADTNDKKQEHLKPGGKRRKTFVAAGTILLLIASAAMLLFTSMNEAPASNMAESSIFYFDTLSNSWKDETFTLRSNSAEEMVSSVLERLVRIPAQTPSLKTIPRDIELLEVVFRDNTVEIVFSENYAALSFVDANICVATVVWSLTSLDFVEYVHFYVGTQELTGSDGLATGLLGRAEIVLDSELLPNEISQKTIKLYFANSDFSTLVLVERTIDTQSNKPLENYIIEELAKGPQDKDLNRLLPTDTKIRGDIKIDGGICYLDFSSDFLNRIDNEDLRRLTIYSIVNSLIDNSSAKQVQILINGDKAVEAKPGAPDISIPIGKDETLISQ